MGTTFSWGSKEVKKEATRSWKPLKTLRVTTRAIVATATPTTEMALMTLMALVDFFEKRYRRAMKNGKFTFLLFQEFVYALDIIQRVVDKETQLGDDAQLVTHART